MPLPEKLRALPRLPLALLPAPLHPLPHLQAALGPDAPRLFIKRDDLTGLALGGNKARKLEFLLGDARACQSDILLTCGAAQSNHALQTAAAARRCGFDARCILYGSPPNPNVLPTGNLLLHRWLDTPLVWTTLQAGETRREQALRRTLAEEAARLTMQGRAPYSIPIGGSTMIGTMGYVQAMVETGAQIEAMGIGSVSAVFFASGSGGTHAGMIVGARADVWRYTRLIGVEVDPQPRDSENASPLQRATLRLANEASARLDQPADFTLADVELEPDYAGPAYGAMTASGEEAIGLLARTEGIFLDPVYSGKALAALLGWIQAGRFRPDDTVLFWHTGGVAGLFAAH